MREMILKVFFFVSVILYDELMIYWLETSQLETSAAVAL